MNATNQIIPSDHEKSEWSRMASDAYSKGFNPIGHKFSLAASMRNGEQRTLASFDSLQAEYRAWLIDGFSTPPVPDEFSHRTGIVY